MCFSLHRAQVTSVGMAAFHWERRWRVLEREVFRFGTGMMLPSLLVRLQGLAGFIRFKERGQGRPPRIVRLMCVRRVVFESEPA